MKIGDFKFEGMKSFTYFRSVVNNENKLWTDHSNYDSKLCMCSVRYTFQEQTPIPKN